MGRLQHTDGLSDDQVDLLALVRELAIVHGTVTLSSGREADYYVDLRRITLSGRAAPLVGRVMLALTADLDFDAVGGLTLGADPVAVAIKVCYSRLCLDACAYSPPFERPRSWRTFARSRSSLPSYAF